MSVPDIPGPFWVRTNTNGTHDVCGRHGAKVRSYMPDQIALADLECRRFQKRFVAADKRVHDAAPQLLEALHRLLEASERHIFGDECLAERVAARAAISKATGAA